VSTDAGASFFKIGRPALRSKSEIRKADRVLPKRVCVPVVPVDPTITRAIAEGNSSEQFN
jgi:hypothetical protein